jgi:hypothetical protein
MKILTLIFAVIFAFFYLIFLTAPNTQHDPGSLKTKQELEESLKYQPPEPPTNLGQEVDPDLAARLKDKKPDSDQESVKGRMAYAKELETCFLEKGMDFYITVSGKSKTAITFKWILMSRPLVYQINKDELLLRSLKRRGFKTATFTDGYHQSWEIDLAKM